jgi:hypothetical protein
MSRYKCFLDSKEAEKGSDCLESFRSMQQCFAENPEHYKVLSLHPCAREVTPSAAAETTSSGRVRDIASTQRVPPNALACSLTGGWARGDGSDA